MPFSLNWKYILVLLVVGIILAFSILQNIKKEELGTTETESEVSNQTEEVTSKTPTQDAELETKITGLPIAPKSNPPDLPREYEENLRTHFPEFGEAVIAGDCSAVGPYYRKSCDYYLSVYSRELIPLITPDDLSESALYFPDLKDVIIYGNSSCEASAQKMITSFYGYFNDETMAFDEVVDFCYQLSALINADISICEKSSSEDSKIYCEKEVRSQAGHFFGGEHPIFEGMFEDF